MNETQDISGVKTFTNTIIGDISGSATTLATPRAIAGVNFDGSAPISLSSANLSNSANIILDTASQTITNKNIVATQLTGTINNDRISMSSTDLTNSADIVLTTANNTFTGSNVFNGNVNFTPGSSLVSGGMRFNTTGISYPTEQSNESASPNTFHALMFKNNKYRMNMNGGNLKSISSNVVSDVRIKSNIRGADDKDGTELINKLEVKRFDIGYTEYSKQLNIEITPMDNQIGFIAQELEPLCPEAVEDEGQIKSIDLSYIVPYLVKNIQQNNKIITELNKKVEELEETILGLMDT